MTPFWLSTLIFAIWGPRYMKFWLWAYFWCSLACRKPLFKIMISKGGGGTGMHLMTPADEQAHNTRHIWIQKFSFILNHNFVESVNNCKNLTNNSNNNSSCIESNRNRQINKNWIQRFIICNKFTKIIWSLNSLQHIFLNSLKSYD